MNILPNSVASRRTKNRLHEHGPFEELQRRDNVFNLGPSVLVSCLREKCDWTGWFPLVEIDIQPTVAPTLEPCDCMAFQDPNTGDTVCKRCRGDWYGCDCPIVHTRKCPERPKES